MESGHELSALRECRYSNTCIHTVRSARVLTPHYRSQHIQAKPDTVLYSLSPDDGHNDAQNKLSLSKVNKHLYLCHLLVLSSPNVAILSEILYNKLVIADLHYLMMMMIIIIINITLSSLAHFLLISIPQPLHSQSTLYNH